MLEVATRKKFFRLLPKEELKGCLSNRLWSTSKQREYLSVGSNGVGFDEKGFGQQAVYP
jgi:hypothetical protein